MAASLLIRPYLGLSPRNEDIAVRAAIVVGIDVGENSVVAKDVSRIPLSAEQRRGCMLVNSAPALAHHDLEFQEIIADRKSVV